MARWLLLLSMLLAWAAHAAEPPSSRFALAPLPEGARLALAPVDAAKERAAAQADEAGRVVPMRYGLLSKVSDVGAAHAKGGDWQALPDGRLLWRVEVSAAGAVSLDFGFSRFRLPAGAQLWIVPAAGESLGPYTDRDNRSDGLLYTPVAKGERATLELLVPAALRDRVQLQLADVGRGFRDILASDFDSAAKSGACNVDVACPAGDPWRDQIGAVARYTFREGSSTFLCTGQLMADATGSTAQRLFSTANHCIESDAAAATLVAYWRYESPTCRTPGSSSSGTRLPTSTAVATQDGATLRATHAPSDFTMLSLLDPVPAAAEPFWSGWDRRRATAASGAGIHHPAGDEKRIAIDNGPTALNDSGEQGVPGTFHHEIVAWDLGTTEQGSSGSGFWNQDKRLIGVLSGGYAACTSGAEDNNLPDFYGRLDTAWDGGGTPATRMRDWLDPQGSGTAFADGTAGCTAPTVTLSSTAFTTAPLAGATVSLQASATGGAGGYRYAWDLDGDAVIDRSGTQATLQASFPAATSTQVSVTVADSSGCSATASRALDVRGPEFTATTTTLQQLCGDHDGIVDPGERWRIPLGLRNDGDGGFATAGRALFVPSASGAPIGPDAYGYTASTTANGGCAFDFIDLTGAVAALPLVDAGISGSLGARDDGRIATAIDLGAGVPVYGQTVTRAVMSTNGYISFSDAESGGDFSNDCDGLANNNSVQPRLHVFHDDLVVSQSPGAGLRHRYFASCPRAPDTDGAVPGCHVFQWSGMQLWDGGTPTGNFDFQAVLYEDTGQVSYQYRNAAPDEGAGATIGLVAATPAQGLLNIACDEFGAVPAASAVCIFDPAAPKASSAGVRVETPAPVLPAVAAGATGSVAVDFLVPADTACGSPVRIDFRGAANATQSAPTPPQAVLDTVVGGSNASCNVVQCSAEVPEVDARYGLVFSHARPGNGLLNFVYEFPGGDTYGGVWYTALPDRTPTWYTVQGEHADNLGIAALREFTNTAAPSGFAPEGEVVGSAWVAQPATDEVVFAWAFDDGRRGIELLRSIGLSFPSPNRTQLWYAPPESGWGHGVESSQFGDGSYNEFWATFLYDSDGVARWLSGGTAQREGAVPMAAQRVHCPGCPFLLDQLELAQPAGSLSRIFTGSYDALLDTSLVLPAPLSGSWQRNDLPIEPLGTIDPP